MGDSPPVILRQPMDLALLLLALLGHAALWVALVNRTHAIGLRRRTMNWITLCSFLCLPAVPLAAGAWLLRTGARPLDLLQDDRWTQPGALALVVYLAVCWIAAGITIPRWFRRHLLRRPPSVLRSARVRRLTVGKGFPPDVVDLAPPGALAPSDGSPHHFLTRVPGNQSLQLDLSVQAIAPPRLPPALDGLSICHLSDLHLTGRVTKFYFQEVVRLSNELQPDLVAITGDLVEREECVDWVPETLGRLRARFGVYFVLGNHDNLVNVQRLLRVLRASGLVHLGGRWIEVPVRGQRVILVGNELPWFGPSPDLADCPPRDATGLRIVLAHTPDHLPWARAGDADLLLAGHTHGGQIRLPWIGPIFAPTLAGVTHASGLFYYPPTILHVTRGLSGQYPIRFNCRPELAHLVLHAAPG